MLGNIGPLELLVILIIALLVFGPKRLPELGSSLGRGIREFREGLNGERGDDEDGESEAEQGAKQLELPTVSAGPTAARQEQKAVSDKRT